MAPLSDAKAPKSGTLVGNIAEPIRLAELQLDGISASAARPGEKIELWTRLFLTSDEKIFHRIVSGIAAHLSFRASHAGHPVALDRAGVVLLVVKPDNTGNLWVDTAAMSNSILARRHLEAGTVVFESDILDVLGVSFPLAGIEAADRVIVIMRVGWRFAFFADFNPERQFSVPNMERDLGTLYRQLKYADLYDALNDNEIADRLTNAGWFPFAQILPAEFMKLVRTCEAGFPLEDAETELLASFDAARLEKMFTRWMTKDHFAGKEAILRSALRSYLAEDPVAVLKITLTEIEGILSQAYRKQYGKGARLKRLLAFAIETGQQRTGAPDTLLLTEAFGKFLQSSVFADFDPAEGTGTAGSRHAVGHGAAPADTYTMTRALQALLTLDQLAFYT